MARIKLPTSQPFYDAAQRFVDAALAHDDSLFTPGTPIWTAANIEELHRRFNEQPDASGGSFLDKFERQLAGGDGRAPASAEIYQLAGEIIFVHLLIVFGSIGGPAKRRLINTVLNWSPAPVSIPLELDTALDHGLAKVGTAFLTYRPFQLWFLIDFAQAWKQLPATQRDTLLRDPWAFKSFVFSLPISAAYAQREALLHIVHPNTFEPMVSRDHKNNFARNFAAYNTDTSGDVDRALYSIRENFQARHGYVLDFYGHTPESPEGRLPRTLGSQLRPYVTLAASLNGSNYRPEQIIDRLGRIAPPIVNLRVAPDAQQLVRDMQHLRLLKPLESGDYRRWSEIDDAPVELLLRYSALALLLPNSQGGFEMPAVYAPFDGQPHPVGEWPLDGELLPWYEEARLVQRTSDGMWQSLPDALEPPAGETPTARTLATFLRNLNQVRQGMRDLPDIEDEALPLIPAATLEERIAEIQRELLINRMTILRIYRALVAGQHVILSGPPGTGKTHLARLIPRVLWRDAEPIPVLDMPTDPAQPATEPPVERPLQRDGYAIQLVTATEDWSVRHVVGGIVPRLEQEGTGRRLVYGISHGSLTRAALGNYTGYDGEKLPSQPFQRKEIRERESRFRGQWLVIDEFTRAPIDGAFGSLLTTLGGQRSPLMVPLDGGGEQAVPLPLDFRIIGTLNSFDRHFLNQISEAMKRRFTFIDILPPAANLAAVEQGAVVLGTLVKLKALGFETMSGDLKTGNGSWDGVLSVARTAGNEAYPLSYEFQYEDAEAETTLASFWRIFRAVRVYRQLGTAQAEAVCTALFTGRSIGMSWSDALDSALADTLADQLQVLGRDEQSVLLAYLTRAANSAAFTDSFTKTLDSQPVQRRTAHLRQLNLEAQITAEQLGTLFELGETLNIGSAGLFAARLQAFISERGL